MITSIQKSLLKQIKQNGQLLNIKKLTQQEIVTNLYILYKLELINGILLEFIKDGSGNPVRSVHNNLFLTEKGNEIITPRSLFTKIVEWSDGWSKVIKFISILVPLIVSIYFIIYILMK